MLKHSAALTALAALCCGCFAPPPARDPLAGLDLSSFDPAFKNVTVGVILSPGAKDSLALVDKWNVQYFGAGRIPALQGFIDGYVAFLQKTFKSAVRLDRAEDAQTLHLDLITVLDLHFDQFAYARSSTGQFTAKSIFLAPGGNPLAEAANQVSLNRSGMGYNMAFYGRLIGDAFEGMQRKIPALPALIEFARAGGKAPLPVATERAPLPERTPTSDVDAPAYHADEAPDDVALVIGVDKYQSLPRAEFAERDAQAVKSHLLALGYAPRNVVTLLGPLATKTGIEKYVETWLPQNSTRDSRVFVYFSGHGSPDPISGQAYLVPWDGDVKYLSQTGYPLKRLYERLNGLNAKQVLVAMDSCFSGAGGRSLLPRGARPLVNKVDVGGAGKIVVLAASAADEISGVDIQAGHGLFTYYLLKGLNLKGGQATARDLFRFLLPKVQDAARGDNREQTPQLIGPDQIDAVLR